ncbi:response regulator [Paenibacillus filicis]|uniref:Response regulator n=1 Tax=Paenibacillus gyeongsangnamensis TaxID=3388067 RepID=A0ABT4QBN3_9BACL|nr:response regulator [Paenibacillus filicis]MCZ8514191.1 response regulator [Paenibacillus filicis]
MKQILIVDDEPMIRLGLAKMIKSYHRFHTITAVPNGVEALEVMNRGIPDVVLTDIRMPKMDGLELCRELSVRKHGTSVVVISGYGDFSYAQKCLTYGVKEYLLKPVTELELFPVLDRLLQEEDKAAFSISDFEEWADAVHTAIWSADRDTLTDLLNQLKEGGLYAGLSAEQLQQTAADGLKLVVKKLNARELFRFELPPDQAEAQTHEQASEWFETCVYRLCDQLMQWRGGIQKSVFEEAKAYIDDHIAEEISLEAVAERVGLAPTYFSSFFKKMTQETFVQYRMRKRIEMAKKLLEQPHVKIVDVGMEIGYQNYPHFTKIFKKVTGITPTEYRHTLGIR